MLLRRTVLKSAWAPELMAVRYQKRLAVRPTNVVVEWDLKPWKQSSLWVKALFWSLGFFFFLADIIRIFCSVQRFLTSLWIFSCWVLPNTFWTRQSSYTCNWSALAKEVQQSDVHLEQKNIRNTGVLSHSSCCWVPPWAESNKNHSEWDCRRKQFAVLTTEKMESH